MKISAFECRSKMHISISDPFLNNKKYRTLTQKSEMHFSNSLKRDHVAVIELILFCREFHLRYHFGCPKYTLRYA